MLMAADSTQAQSTSSTIIKSREPTMNDKKRAEQAAKLAARVLEMERDEVVITNDCEEIDLTHTRQPKIPDAIANLQHLKKLCMRWNLLKEIDTNICKLTTLTYLDLYDNQIEKIENLDALVNLEHLDLSFNRLTVIEGLGKLEKLRTLYLVHNRIKKIENLDKNVELRLLELGDNQLRKIENLAHLTKLERLFVGANKIRKIEGIETLPLRTFSIPANRITIIENLSMLDELEEIYLAQNGIAKLEGFDKNLKLKVLDLNYNLMDTINNVSHLVELTDFWMSHNKLTSLENAIQQLQPLHNLRTLYLTANPLAEPEPAYRRKLILNLPQVTRIDYEPCRLSPSKPALNLHTK